MITYSGGSFGYKVLFRLHGSAIFKSLTPALLSSAIFLLLFEFTNVGPDTEDGEVLLMLHPYPMGALIAAFSFLLIFRANFAYNRYWEAQTAVHLMHSKWLDFGTEIAAFHYQSERYSSRKPPAFGDYPDVTQVMRERDGRQYEPCTLTELEEKIDHRMEEESLSETPGNAGVTTSLRSELRNRRKKMGSFLRRNKTTPRRTPAQEFIAQQEAKEAHDPRQSFHQSGAQRGGSDPTTGRPTSTTKRSINKPTMLKSKNKKQRKARRENDDFYDQNGKAYSVFKVATRKRLREGHWDPDMPPLFLEECAHLLSLLSAVAFSTLRNDLEEAESPLAEFRPGIPWPHVDPDAYNADIRKEWARSSHSIYTILRYLFGISRTDKSRTLYNAGRPFRVIGNVSDLEIEMLQKARGPQAKVALCSLWLQEFLSREYMSGSTGKVAAPIISRLYQFVSDGMMGYNQARKIAYIPFPFPHAQITSLFVLVILGAIPVIMLTYITSEVFGFLLNLCCVMCFTGLHEVARELEAPFQNVPNDIPLNNFQAQFNEALMVMFFGYHPDAYWKVQQDEYPKLPEHLKNLQEVTEENECVEEDEEEMGDVLGGIVETPIGDGSSGEDEVISTLTDVGMKEQVSPSKLSLMDRNEKMPGMESYGGVPPEAATINIPPVLDQQFQADGLEPPRTIFQAALEHEAGNRPRSNSIARGDFLASF